MMKQSKTSAPPSKPEARRNGAEMEFSVASSSRAARAFPPTSLRHEEEDDYEASKPPPILHFATDSAERDGTDHHPLAMTSGRPAAFIAAAATATIEPGAVHVPGPNGPDLQDDEESAPTTRTRTPQDVPPQPPEILAQAHLVEGQAVAAPPDNIHPGPPVAAQASPWWFKPRNTCMLAGAVVLLLVILAVVVAVVVTYLVTGSDSGSSPTGSTSTTAPPASVPTPALSPTPEPTSLSTPAPFSTNAPTVAPTRRPTTAAPVSSPVEAPTPSPTPLPTPSPTPEPTPSPTPEPTPRPTPAPTARPTPFPTPPPTPRPTLRPTTTRPTPVPTVELTSEPPTMEFPPESTVEPTTEFKLTACVAVIDESSVPDPVITQQWETFRTLFPRRSFCLLQPGTIGRLFLPSDFVSDSQTTFSVVNRDLGDRSQRSDWFDICDLEGASGVSLFIDNTGSMTTATVQASFDLFQEKLDTAGLIIVQELQNSNEDWIEPFITGLPI